MEVRGGSVEAPWRFVEGSMEVSMELHGGFHRVPNNVGVRVRVRVRCPTLSGTPCRSPRSSMELRGGLRGAP